MKLFFHNTKLRVVTEEIKCGQHVIVVASARNVRPSDITLGKRFFLVGRMQSLPVEPCAVLYPVAPRCIKLSDQSGGALSLVGARPCVGLGALRRVMRVVAVASRA